MQGSLAFRAGGAVRNAALAARGVRPGRVAGRRLVVQARQAEAGVGIFGTKAGMMTYFTPEGAAVPATVIALEEGNYVTGLKTADTDGYSAVQVGYKVVAERKVRKPELGHLSKAGCPPMKHLREFRVSPAAVLQPVWLLWLLLTIARATAPKLRAQSLFLRQRAKLMCCGCLPAVSGVAC